MEISKITKLSQPQPKADKPKVEKAAVEVRSKGENGSQQNNSTSQAVSEKKLVQAAKELEVRFNLSVKMVTDEATGREVVRIFSKDGKRLLRQMPPDQVLRMADQARQGTLESILNSVV